MRFKSEKRPSERLPLALDFAASLPAGDPISTLAVSANDGYGLDVTASLVVGSSFLGSVCTAIVKDGTHGKTYYVVFLVTTAAGLKFESDIEMRVDRGA